jgi:hypothetical protein
MYSGQLVSKSVMEDKSLREGKESLLSKTMAPTISVKTPRIVSMATINFRRSNLSVITPACKVNINHGRREAKPAAAISNGERVTADATHGYATPDIPSPKLEIAVALHKRQ